MRLRNVKFVQGVFVTVLVLLVTLSFVNSPGTNDVVAYWVPWANNSDALGSPAGFAADEAQYGYPPYGSIIFANAVRVSRLFGIGTFGAVKLSILLFLVLTSVIVWLWTRDLVITVILHLSLLLNSVALGYIDIFFAPSLILSMWALKEQKWAWFTVFYGIACLTKWQPLIMAPFIVLYLLNINRVTDWRQIDFKRLARKVLIPALALLILTLAAFGGTPLLTSLDKALNNEFLSGDALNFNWIVTHWLHVFYPQEFGSLIGGEAGYIVTTAPKVTLIPKLLFLLTYIVSILSFFRRDKSFENLISFSLIGYLAYFIFNTGVHENHLFLAAILSIILFWVNRDHLWSMVILVLMSNINLLVFFEIDGAELRFSRVITNAVDIALLLSIFNVSFFLMLWAVTIQPSRAASGARNVGR